MSNATYVSSKRTENWPSGLKHDIVDFDKSSVVGFEGVNSRAYRNDLAYKYKMFTIKTQLLLLLFFPSIRQVEHNIYLERKKHKTTTQRTSKNSQESNTNKSYGGLERYYILSVIKTVWN